ncbi:hypothetical protein ACRAQ7_05845 [Erythrobacter sp. W53]|uniref:hypothetical protein n=1 Tax=Erythrobacter sp. W53 TaxID=3425947 RepID=UPI003D768077
MSSDNGNVVLLVEDDGAGFEKEEAMSKSGSLGMSLVDDLASQVEATTEVTSNEAGTRWKLTLDPRPDH